MALREILHNIQCFIDILQQTRCRAVETWRAEDVKNAMNWADYCEKIYSKSVGKPYQADLDENIHAMQESQVWLLGRTKIGLELLKDAGSIIRQSLLENPWLSQDVYQALLDKTDQDTLIEDLMTVTRTSLTIDQLQTQHHCNVHDAEVEILQNYLSEKTQIITSHDVLSNIQSYLDTIGDMEEDLM